MTQHCNTNAQLAIFGSGLLHRQENRIHATNRYLVLPTIDARG